MWRNWNQLPQLHTVEFAMRKNSKAVRAWKLLVLVLELLRYNLWNMKVSIPAIMMICCYLFIFSFCLFLDFYFLMKFSFSLHIEIAYRDGATRKGIRPVKSVCRFEFLSTSFFVLSFILLLLFILARSSSRCDWILIFFFFSFKLFNQCFHRL